MIKYVISNYFDMTEWRDNEDKKIFLLCQGYYENIGSKFKSSIQSD